MNRSKKLLLAAAVAVAAVSGAQTQDSSKTKPQEERPFQLTLISPIGTNGIESYKIANKVSINIIAGFNGGVNGIEGAGFANVIYKDVKGAQGAGFANVVLGNVKGLQGAGFANVVLGNVKGAQGAGYINYSGGNYEGAAFSGFSNVNLGKMKGGQFTGFLNVNIDSLVGGQLAGFANVNLNAVKGIQGAGFLNYAKGIKGLQGAGFANVSLGDVKGAQLAGFANVTTGNVTGVQASGFLNIAKKVKGAQLGFINIADSVDGASIGFLTIVKNGLHQVEISADELFYANASIRTGTHRFYNIFTAGASPSSGDFLWHIGYGMGTSFKVNEKIRTDLSLSGQHISSGLFYHATSELYKVYVGMEYKLANKCFIAAGPTFNLYFSDAYLPAYGKTYSSITPYSFMDETNSYGFNFKAWVGAKVAIRFL